MEEKIWPKNTEEEINQKKLKEKVKCPFCPLKEETEWYLTSPEGIVVCRSIETKGHKLCLLIVGNGKFWHRPEPEYTTDEVAKMINMGMQVAKELIYHKHVNKIVRIDVVHLNIVDHFHIQIYLD